MKPIFVIYMLLAGAGSSNGQDTLAPSFQAVMKEFSTNSVQVNSYKQLPRFIITSGSLFNLGWGSGKEPYYIAKTENDYLVAYEHGEVGNHFHARVFKTNAREILNVYDFIISEHRKNQDVLILSKVQAIARDFAENSTPVKSYAQLPECIIQYLNQKVKNTFSLSTHRFNDTDAGRGPRRKLAYIAQLDNNYILSYEHGGIGYHFHSIIFETDGKEIINVSRLISGQKHAAITELIMLIEIGNIFLNEEDEY